MSQEQREKQRKEKAAKKLLEEERLKALQGTSSINLDDLAEKVAKNTPNQANTVQVNTDEIAEKVAKRIPTQQQQTPQINVVELADEVAKKMPIQQQQNSQINIVEIADEVIKRMPAQQSQTPQINIKELADEVAKRMPAQKAIETSSPGMDSKEIAKLVLSELSKNQNNIGQVNVAQQESCSDKTTKLIELLRSQDIVFSKSKDLKDNSEQLYTLYRSLDIIEGSYGINYDSANRFNSKAIAVQKSNKPLFGKFSSAKDALLEVNTVMEDSTNSITSAITKIKNIMPKEFITNLDKLAEHLKNDSKATEMFTNYCGTCINDLEKLTENEQLVLFSSCTAKMLLGLDSIAEQPEI